MLASSIPSLRPRSDEQSEHDSRHQSAQMRGHADLGRGQIECGLDSDDKHNIFQTPASEWFRPMAQKITGPDADDSHHATGGADELFRLGLVRPFQKQNASARSEPSEQITKRESHRSDDSFQTGSDDKERVKIEGNMQRPEMQKERGQHPPVLAAIADSPRLERAEAMQSKRIRRTG